MTRSSSRFKMLQLLSSKDDGDYHNKDYYYSDSDVVRWCSRSKKTIDIRFDNQNHYNLNHLNNSNNKIDKSIHKFWSYSNYCDDDYNSTVIPHHSHHHISSIHANKINRCQILSSITTKMSSLLSSLLLFKDFNNNRMVSTIIVLLICIINNIVTPIMAQNDNNNWRHRSSSSSTNLKRLRSTPHLLNSPMNYSSSIITPTISAGYSVQSKQHQQQQNQRPFLSSSSHSSSPSSSSSIHDSRHHHQHRSHAASPYYNSQLLSIPFPSTNQLMYQHPELTHNYFHQISAPGTSVIVQHNPTQQNDGIGPGSSSVIQSNQIPRSINPSLMDRAQNNLMPMKGSKWWDIARHSPNMERISLDQTQHMDGRHTNAILPSSAISVGGNGQEILSTMNLPLRKKQRKLVRDNPGMLTAISRAMKMAISECQEQFKDRRWNCPVNDWKKGKHVFGKIIQRGCRETAFVYALTSAAVAHSLARACSEGLIETCTCDFRNNRKPSGIDWEWGGCSDNIEFGYKFARQFVDSAERGRDLRFVMNLHNNEAGRLHVSNEMVRECKCHGMSGSCTVKTCWMRLPSFHDVGKNLKDRFDGASRVSMSNEYRGFTRKMMKKVQLKPYENGYKIPTREDLIYFEESPDFCVPNLKYGIMGTQGRTCNATSIGVDGCNLLCCGRGYTTEEKEVYERCNCTFQWCCQVNCKICKIKKKIYRCK